jgi:SpoVK/Ycf46/Vps4 family AAA+-type ATPase
MTKLEELKAALKAAAAAEDTAWNAYLAAEDGVSGADYEAVCEAACETADAASHARNAYFAELKKLREL